MGAVTHPSEQMVIGTGVTGKMKEASFSLKQHLKDLLTQENPDNHQGQDHREQLDVGRLVEPFVYKINAGN
jgi:hypothetical protein